MYSFWKRKSWKTISTFSQVKKKETNYFLILHLFFAVFLNKKTAAQIYNIINEVSNKCQQKMMERGCPRGVMVKAMDYGIVVHEFVLQSRYYVHFRANTLGKGMNPLILPAMG